jgi:hypothetical protein
VKSCRPVRMYQGFRESCCPHQRSKRIHQPYYRAGHYKRRLSSVTKPRISLSYADVSLSINNLKTSNFQDKSFPTLITIKSYALTSTMNKTWITHYHRRKSRWSKCYPSFFTAQSVCTKFCHQGCHNSLMCQYFKCVLTIKESEYWVTSAVAMISLHGLK